MMFSIEITCSYKNGKLLEEDERVKVMYQTKEVFELFIDHAKTSDGGEYRCVAKNNQGEDETSAKISVTSK